MDTTSNLADKSDAHLIAEWHFWNDKILSAKGWGAALAAAGEFRNETEKLMRLRSIPIPRSNAITWLGGNCPVQAEGFIDGKPFYFRARGEHWSLKIGGADIIVSPEWQYKEDYGNGPFDAGWMSEDEARAFITKAARLYFESR